MAEAFRKLMAWASFFIGATGMGFLMLGVMMAVTGIGRNPLLASGIGLVMLLTASLISGKAFPRCPRCGSDLIEDGRCQVCDYDLRRER